MSGRPPRPDGLDINYVRQFRSGSVSSDVMSASAKSAATSHHVPAANPAPAYIAQAEASELISSELDRNVIISPTALMLVNEFLDHVLYTLITTSQSVSLGNLKAAVPNVLKPRLGKAALRVAEEELKEYMEEEDELELYNKRDSRIASPDFNVDLVWKLTRLRCMVYARMGDLEEEDEEEWLEKERLLEQAAATPSTETRQSMEVGPAAAIFLTSVIEYLGEQALYYAAQHAQKRHDTARAQNRAAPTMQSGLTPTGADEIVLDGKDMNHVGRDSPLSRLWRSWRRNTRATESWSRPMSPENDGPDSPHSKLTSSSHPISSILEERQPTPAELPVPQSPSQIPLPMTDHDLEEIEGKGFWAEQEERDDTHKKRLSLQMMPGHFPSFEEPEKDDAEEPPQFQERSPMRPTYVRLRSSSIPYVKPTFAYFLGDEEVQVEDDAIAEDDEAAVPREPSDFADGKAVGPTTEAQSINDTVPAENGTSLPVDNKHQTTAKSIPEPEAHAETNGAPKQSMLVNNTIAALAGNFGAVGVYQVRSRSPPLSDKAINNAEPSSYRNVSGPTTSPAVPSNGADSSVGDRKAESPVQPVMSPSITSPADFNDMHVPEDRYTSVSRSTKTPEPTSIHNEVTVAPEQTTPKAVSKAPAAQQTINDRGLQHISTSPESEDQFHDARPYRSSLPAVVEATSSSYLNSDSSASPPGSRKRFSDGRSSPTATRGVAKTAVTAQAAAATAEPVDMYSPSHSKSSSSSSRLLGFTRDSSGRPQKIHQQHAAGEMLDEVRAAHSSTPTNGHARNRPETSSSSSSTKRKQHLRIRDDSRSGGSSPVDEAAKRSLEVLINSDETLHYTLTPATATFNRQETPRSHPRTHTQELADFFRNTAPPESQNGPAKAGRSRKTSVEANRPPAAVNSPRKPLVVDSNPKYIPSTKQYAASTTPSQRQRNPIGMPRDAKVDNSHNTRDLADYARSTGPSNEAQLPQALSSVRGSISKSQGPTSPGANRSPAKQRQRTGSNSRLQARDARPSNTAEQSELIDFIREGPPRDRGDHRINRNVAPFRTTMDSDDINALAQADQSSNGTKSVLTNGSGAPLLKNNQNSSARRNVRPAASFGNDSDGMPQKTRRRVKDPYAIDDSDDDIFNEEPQPKQREEESLMDFLRNTAPTRDMTAKPIMSSPEQAKAAMQRTPSASKLRGLVAGTRRSIPSLSTAQEGVRSPPARAESPHLTQSGSKLDSYRPTQATHASHVERNRNKAKIEPKAAAPVPASSVRGVGATGDLADYLKNTGPPPGASYTPQPFILSGKNDLSNIKGANGAPAKEEGTFKKFLSRRGKK